MLTRLLARHKMVTCAVPEVCVVLNVSVLCAEVRNKYGASQRPVVMSLGRWVGEMASLGGECRCEGASEAGHGESVGR